DSTTGLSAQRVAVQGGPDRDEHLLEALRARGPCLDGLDRVVELLEPGRGVMSDDLRASELELELREARGELATGLQVRQQQQAQDPDALPELPTGCIVEPERRHRYTISRVGQGGETRAR